MGTGVKLDRPPLQRTVNELSVNRDQSGSIDIRTQDLGTTAKTLGDNRLLPRDHDDAPLLATTFRHPSTATQVSIVTQTAVRSAT